MAFEIKVTVKGNLLVTVRGYSLHEGLSGIELTAFAMSLPIGAIRLLFQLPNVKVATLEVADEFRRRGIGTVLLQQAILACAAADMKLLEANADEAGAKQFLLVNDGRPLTPVNAPGDTRFSWDLLLPPAPGKAS